jgi:hypothetical protein
MIEIGDGPVTALMWLASGLLVAIGLLLFLAVCLADRVAFHATRARWSHRASIGSETGPKTDLEMGLETESPRPVPAVPVVRAAHVVGSVQRAALFRPGWSRQVGHLDQISPRGQYPGRHRGRPIGEAPAGVAPTFLLPDRHATAHLLQSELGQVAPHQWFRFDRPRRSASPLSDRSRRVLFC